MRGMKNMHLGKNDNCSISGKKTRYILMMQFLWIQFMTSTRPKEEILRISDAPKIDNFGGLPEPQIP